MPGTEEVLSTLTSEHLAADKPRGVQSQPKILWSAGGGAEPTCCHPAGRVRLTILLLELPTQSLVLSFQLYLNVLIICKFQKVYVSVK